MSRIVRFVALTVTVVAIVPAVVWAATGSSSDPGPRCAIEAVAPSISLHRCPGTELRRVMAVDRLRSLAELGRDHEAKLHRTIERISAPLVPADGAVRLADVSTDLQDHSGWIVAVALPEIIALRLADAAGTVWIVEATTTFDASRDVLVSRTVLRGGDGVMLDAIVDRSTLGPEIEVAPVEHRRVATRSHP